MSVGATIRRLRKARGLTILDVATIIGSDVGNLSRLERGEQGYSQAILEKIAGALEVRVVDLFASEEDVDVRRAHFAWPFERISPQQWNAYPSMLKHYAEEIVMQAAIDHTKKGEDHALLYSPDAANTRKSSNGK
jgi:transcriptional regulator with XRE-family HTH domain